ncbi:Hypothetical protein POVN_LOCUS297 [uncultured virus]|nr:Hypothetical protein POVN_LOCUS297 [uncultured virus]
MNKWYSRCVPSTGLLIVSLVDAVYTEYTGDTSVVLTDHFVIMALFTTFIVLMGAAASEHVKEAFQMMTHLYIGMLEWLSIAVFLIHVEVDGSGYGTPTNLMRQLFAAFFFAHGTYLVVYGLYIDEVLDVSDRLSELVSRYLFGEVSGYHI